MTATRTAVPLAQIRKTRISGGQCWQAQTTDGLWGFDRLEDAATTWEVVHLPTRTVVQDFLGSLRWCRAYVASGEAEADLARLQAHERGDHERNPDPICGRCRP